MLQLTMTDIRKPYLEQKLEPDMDQSFEEVAFCVRSFPGIVRVSRPQIWDLRQHLLTRKCDLKLNVM